MKTRLFLLFLASLLIAPGLVFGATYHGSFNVDVGTGSIVINPDACEEDWSGSFWSDCQDGTKTFVCFDRNNCGTESLKPAQCGEIQNCSQSPTPPTTTTGGGGGGGGGGGSSSDSGTTLLTTTGTTESENKPKCIERWRCTGWSNTDDFCGVRTCEDINKCGTTELKPETSRECPTFSSSFLTGGVIGAISSPTGLSIIFILAIVALFILVTVSRKGAGKISEKVIEKPEEPVKGKDK